MGKDIFCGQNPERTETLFSTAHFYVIPVKYPLTPGHLLIIPKSHHLSFGEVPLKWQAELDYVTATCRRFVRDTYGLDAVIWENGGPESGQTIPHAHLHMIPAAAEVTAILPARIDSKAVHGLADLHRVWRRPAVRTIIRRLKVASHQPGELSRVTRPQPYQYFDFNGDRRVIRIPSKELNPMILWRTVVWGVKWKIENGVFRWERPGAPDEVTACVALFRAWEAKQPRPRQVA